MSVTRTARDELFICNIVKHWGLVKTITLYVGLEVDLWLNRRINVDSQFKYLLYLISDYGESAENCLFRQTKELLVWDSDGHVFSFSELIVANKYLISDDILRRTRRYLFVAKSFICRDDGAIKHSPIYYLAYVWL